MGSKSDPKSMHFLYKNHWFHLFLCAKISMMKGLRVYQGMSIDWLIEYGFLFSRPMYKWWGQHISIGHEHSCHIQSFTLSLTHSFALILHLSRFHSLIYSQDFNNRDITYIHNAQDCVSLPPSPCPVFILPPCPRACPPTQWNRDTCASQWGFVPHYPPVSIRCGFSEGPRPICPNAKSRHTSYNVCCTIGFTVTPQQVLWHNAVLVQFDQCAQSID